MYMHLRSLFNRLRMDSGLTWPPLYFWLNSSSSRLEMESSSACERCRLARRPCAAVGRLPCRSMGVRECCECAGALSPDL